MIPKDPTFFLFIKLPISSSCKTYRTVVGVSDSLLSDPVIELRCFLLSIRKSTTSGSARPTELLRIVSLMKFESDFEEIL